MNVNQNHDIIQAHPGKERNMKKYTKYFGAAIFFFLLCITAAIISHNSETLTDYAHREPEVAYREPAETESENEEAETETAQAGTSESVDEISVTKPITEAQAESAGGGTEMNAKEMTANRTIYQPDFYYEPLSEDMKQRITGVSYKEDCPLPYEDLRHVSVLYVNFKGNVSTGDMICNKAIAQDLVEIFYELYQADYQIEQIRLIDEYAADDTLSMQDNNTSCFNYRTIAGTNKISMHGKGLAIDINPFFNPYVTYKNGEQRVSPAGAESYADRSQPFAYKIDENDLCYKLFTQHGFSWGGNWNHSKDYQHFEKKIEE